MRTERPFPNSLCHRCTALRLLTTKRGSVFLMCERAAEDPRFPKYAPQPVLRCMGFENAESPTDPPPARH